MADVKFAIDILHMGFDRIDGNRQVTGNLLIAAFQKNGCTRQRAGVVARCSIGSDQAAAQPDDATVAPGIAGGIFERQTGTLRETR